MKTNQQLLTDAASAIKELLPSSPHNDPQDVTGAKWAAATSNAMAEVLVDAYESSESNEFNKSIYDQQQALNNIFIGSGNLEKAVARYHEITGEPTMTTKQQLADEIKTLQEQHDAMPEVLGINYKPMHGDSYYVIQINGNVIGRVWTYASHDIEAYTTGNCYPTRADAERIVRNRKTLVKLREFAFMPDFENEKQEKWVFDMERGEVGFNHFTTRSYGSPIWSADLNIIKDAYKAVGEAAVADMLKGGLV